MALLLLAQKAERPKSQLVCLTQMEGITSLLETPGFCTQKVHDAWQKLPKILISSITIIFISIILLLWLVVLLLFL